MTAIERAKIRLEMLEEVYRNATETLQHSPENIHGLFYLVLAQMMDREKYTIATKPSWTVIAHASEDDLDPTLRDK